MLKHAYRNTFQYIFLARVTMDLQFIASTMLLQYLLIRPIQQIPLNVKIFEKDYKNYDTLLI